MNFLVIVSDTFRHDFLGCSGNDWVHTPNLDAFAGGAMVFDRAYAASFPTVPHRRDVFTGRYTGTYSIWSPLPKDEVVLAQVLSDAGFTTMMVNDTPHTLENGYHYDRGFQGWEWIRGQETDRWRTDPEAPDLPASPWKLRDPHHSYANHRRSIARRRYETDYFAPRTMTEAARWLERHRGSSKPFFLYVDTFDPHEPWDPPPWYVERYDPGYDGEVVDFPLYTSSSYLTDAELAHVRALYAGEVTMVDRWVGFLLDRLDDLGYADDTMVLFTSDHGFLHGEHGFLGKTVIDPEERGGYSATIGYIPLWEEIARVPFLCRLPGGAAGRSDAYVQAPDVMPTVLELAGVDAPPTVQGRSFAEVLRSGGGPNDAVNDFAISYPSLVVGGMGGCKITLTTPEWSYVCAASDFDDRLFEVMADQIAHTMRDANAVSDVSVDGQEKVLKPVESGVDALYRRDDDGQANDVAAEHPELRRELRAAVVERLRALQTHDVVVSCWEQPLD